MKNIKDNFVSYEMALKLKELGFEEDCLGCYNFDGTYFNKKDQCTYKYDNKYLILIDEAQRSYDNEFLNFTSNKSSLILAPLYQQVQNWLRNIYNIHIQIVAIELPDVYPYYFYLIDLTNRKILNGKLSINYATYEQTLKEALMETLNHIKSTRL